MADPGFPRGGGANSPGGRQHTILPKFPKNCMKLKEFGARGMGGASLAPPLDPPLLSHDNQNIFAYGQTTNKNITFHIPKIWKTL